MREFGERRELHEREAPSEPESTDPAAHALGLAVEGRVERRVERGGAGRFESGVESGDGILPLSCREVRTDESLSHDSAAAAGN